MLSRWLFLRALGLVYGAAFLSFLVQARGLVGEQGILPVGEFLKVASFQFGAAAWWVCPTFSWLNPSDACLTAQAALGVALSILVVAGVGVRPALAFMWLIYLSLTTAGQDFMSFQWDNLLLEAGFLSIFLSSGQMVGPPWRAPEKLMREDPPARAVIWLLRWLLFRVVFFSGAVKLGSGDIVWRDLTAVSYHWHTQPLPMPAAWLAAQLPMWCQKAMAGGVFVFELFVPCLIFAGRKARPVAALMCAFFQLLIALTGNYTFFNFLTAALCLFLVDDAVLSRIRLGRLQEKLSACTTAACCSPKKAVVAIVVALVVLLSGAEVLASAIGGPVMGGLVGGVVSLCAPLRLVNGYGVFAVMTTERMEIVIEGSDDGLHWQAYEFPFKPGDLGRAPPVVAPYQPRLDWQMWFAALSDYQRNLWFPSMIYRVLSGSPDVLALFQTNPFPNRPPKYVRAVGYDYDFTDVPELMKTGHWWRRTFKEVYFPPASLEGR